MACAGHGGVTDPEKGAHDGCHAIRPRYVARFSDANAKEGETIEIVLFGGGVLATALVAALLEVQIEGKNGWAGGLPTWRVSNRVTRALLGRRDVTGYHVYIHLLVLLLVHLPYILHPIDPSWAAEARILSFLILFWLLEDFLWFVVNPAFGLRRFRRDAIPWHVGTWWAFMPRDYWIFLPLGILLYALS